MAQTKYEQLELLRKLSLRIQREIVDRSRNVNKRFHKLALNVACPAP